MFSFLRSSQAGLPDNPVDVANQKNEKDFGITAEKPLAELDSDLSSNVSPGERTFEESMSRWTVLPPIESLLTCFHTRYGRWNGSPFGCIQLHNAHVSTLSYSSLLFSLTTLLSRIGRIIGTGIFSTPSSILGSVGSVGASLMLWVAGFLLSFCGLFIWLEFGSMYPRSGGEKVYLEAVYRRPKYLATVIFAANAIILGFTASNCIVSLSATI